MKILLRMTTAVVLLSICVLLGGCPRDAETAIDNVFKTKGLNRLRTIDDSVRVGQVVIKKGTSHRADNLTDYKYNGVSPVIPTNEKNESKSVISELGANSNISASAAVDLVQAVLPVSAGGGIQLSSNAKVEQITAQTQKIKLTDLKAFLSSPQSSEFKRQMTEYMSQGYEVYIAFEAYRSNRIQLSSTTGQDIYANANVGEIKPFAGAKGGFSLKKDSKLKLDVTGDTYYTFALRTCKLTMKNGAWLIDPAKFLKSGVLAAGDEKFSYSASGTDKADFGPLDLLPKPPLKP